MAVDVRIFLEGDGATQDLADRRQRGQALHGAPPLRLIALDRGMSSGLPAVVIAAELDDGSVVTLQTSMRNFLIAAQIFAAKFPQAVQDPTLRELDLKGRTAKLDFK
jgi:hypothetical protein